CPSPSRSPSVPWPTAARRCAAAAPTASSCARRAAARSRRSRRWADTGPATSVAATGSRAGYDQPATRKTTDQKQAHRCHICGLEFEMGQALGGHMRRHRDEAVATTAQAPPVLLQLFV
ncbi:hypothetical protein CFC21_074476, partial [Triticum aestivum]